MSDEGTIIIRLNQQVVGAYLSMDDENLGLAIRSLLDDIVGEQGRLSRGERNGPATL